MTTEKETTKNWLTNYGKKLNNRLQNRLTDYTKKGYKKTTKRTDWLQKKKTTENHSAQNPVCAESA